MPLGPSRPTYGDLIDELGALHKKHHKGIKRIEELKKLLKTSGLVSFEGKIYSGYIEKGEHSFLDKEKVQEKIGAIALLACYTKSVRRELKYGLREHSPLIKAAAKRAR